MGDEQRAVREALKSLTTRMEVLARECLTIGKDHSDSRDAAMGWLERAEILALLVNDIETGRHVSRSAWRLTPRTDPPRTSG
jgi:hypothetical protein